MAHVPTTGTAGARVPSTGTAGACVLAGLFMLLRAYLYMCLHPVGSKKARACYCMCASAQVLERRPCLQVVVLLDVSVNQFGPLFEMLPQGLRCGHESTNHTRVPFLPFSPCLTPVCTCLWPSRLR